GEHQKAAIGRWGQGIFTPKERHAGDGWPIMTSLIGFTRAPLTTQQFDALECRFGPNYSLKVGIVEPHCELDPRVCSTSGTAVYGDDSARRRPEQSCGPGAFGVLGGAAHADRRLAAGQSRGAHAERSGDPWRGRRHRAPG